MNHAQLNDILNKKILTWTNGCIIDDTMFQSIVNSNPEYENILCRVMYELMEKTEHNLNFLSSLIGINAMPETDIHIDKNLYPALYAIISKPNFEYITFTHGNASKCLELLTKVKLLSSLVSTIKNGKHTEVRSYKVIDMNNKDECETINYVFKNRDMYELLTCGPEKRIQNKDFKKLRVITRLTEYLHTHNFRTSNLEIILNNVETIFKDKNEILVFLTGMVTGIGTLNVLHNEIIRAYKHYYPDELKVVQTMQSLGITDFETIITNILNTSQLQNIEPVELPSL